ncbi:MAG TPA: hypothetical protein VLG38_06480, partial [Gammaproteobacteria bacterium]|nr:hypothetical protein [Gammaproteobacteria bacterium]
QAELGMFLRTYAFRVSVMCDLHKNFADRIHQYHRIGKAEINDYGLIIHSDVQDNLKLFFRNMNPERDAQKIADKINERLTIGKPLLTAAAMATATSSAQANSILKNSNSPTKTTSKKRVGWDQ